MNPIERDKRLKSLMKDWSSRKITFNQLKRADEYGWTSEKILWWDNLSWWEKVKELILDIFRKN
jgi:hypothetical protein